MNLVSSATMKVAFFHEVEMHDLIMWQSTAWFSLSSSDNGEFFEKCVATICCVRLLSRTLLFLFTAPSTAACALSLHSN